MEKTCDQNKNPKHTLEEILVKNSPCKGSGFIRKLIEKKMIKPECCFCNATKSLSPHYLNKDSQDKRLENIILICTNCKSSIANVATNGGCDKNCAECNSKHGV